MFEYFEQYPVRVEAWLEDTPSTRTFLLTVLVTHLLSACTSFILRNSYNRSRSRNTLVEYVQRLPVIQYYIQIVRQKVVSEVSQSTKNNKRLRSESAHLPSDGLSTEAVLAECARLISTDSEHTTKMSGAIYVQPDSNIFKLCSTAYSMFAHTNPLHGDAFPAVSKMESDIVSFTATLLGSKFDDEVCGNLTSGGTESILSAIRTSRDFMRSTRGIKYPEMVVATSAHAAVYKAAEYFNIKLNLICTDKEGRLSVQDLKRSMNKNVILVYASAPGYPHGVIDDVEGIAHVVKYWGCCLHVDACLGGFVLPFAQDSSVLDISYAPFDFRVPEVTSMSVDTHKYGCAQKGSSITLYKTRELRKYQFTAVSSWSGGLYISPSQAGSRSGGLIAQTWAAMMHIGHKGYVSAAESILNASISLRRDISMIEPLEVIGPDITMVVAWRSTSKAVDIYVLNDILSEMGWHLSVLHSPPAVHMCITSVNIQSLKALAEDVRLAVTRIKSGKYDSKKGKAPIYGMANRMSNTSTVDELLRDIQDVMD